MFAFVADFCYGALVVLTPLNVAALLIAAELLEMTESDSRSDESLRQKTEIYFCRVIAVNREYVSIVLHSCLSLLPEAETAAGLVSKCIEALTSIDDGNDVINYLDDIKTLRCEDFQLIAESMHQKLTATGSHDLLYIIVDRYFKEYAGTITDEQKMRICNYIDCSILSPQFLMYAVQNPRMPLRFVVQAMFIEQLNTRRSVLSAANYHASKTRKKDSVTLGAIVQRDAALRQVAHLKSAMCATSSRIQSLEKELSGMSQLVLNNSENMRNVFCSERKVERGQISSSSFVIMSRKEKAGGVLVIR